jgi:hypothetical protein
MFRCSQREGDRLEREVHDGQVLSGQMGNDLIPEGEESILMGFLIPENMQRGNHKGIVPYRVDFIMGDAFEAHPDVEHQHVEMQQLTLLHTITCTLKILKGYRISGAPDKGCHTG